MKNKTLTVIIIISTIVLAVLSVFIVMRIKSLGTKPVAPNVPESKPKATSELPDEPSVAACKKTFVVVAPSATPTPIPGQISCTDFSISKNKVVIGENIGVDFKTNNAGPRSLSVRFKNGSTWDPWRWMKTITTGTHFDFNLGSGSKIGAYQVEVNVYAPNCDPKKVCTTTNQLWDVNPCPLDYSGNLPTNPVDNACSNSCQANFEVVESPTPTPSPGPTSTPPPGTTLTPTPIPTSTPTPGPTNTPPPGATSTPNPTVTPVQIAQATVTSAPSPTEVQLPQAGIKIPALGGIILGFLLISLGVVFIF